MKPRTSSAAAVALAMAAAEQLERARRAAEVRAVAELAPEAAGVLAELGPDLAELLGVCPAARWPELREVLAARSRAAGEDGTLAHVASRTRSPSSCSP